MSVDCLLHVHSSFSYDSQTDLADIAATARRHGFGCVLMSEHNNRMDPDQMAAFVRRCEDVSDDRLLIVPGLELAFDSNRVHLLAYGIRQFIDSTGPECTFGSLVRSVHDAGGLAVLAHPSHRQAIDRLTAEDVHELEGIEIWNVKNGNRFCPSGVDLRTLLQIRGRGDRVFGFAGVDWHHLVNFEPLAVRVEAADATQASIFQALRDGRFTVRGRFVSVASTGETRAGRLALYTSGSSALERTRQMAYRWQRTLEQRGVKTPRALAALARRVF
jgi:hypothetical protein